MTTMKSRWVVLQHVEWEGPGIIAQEAEKHECEVDIRRIDREDELPDADHVDGLVVMGGPLEAYEEDKFPFLRKECELLREVARRDGPMLGVCLGAQMLAKALGAKVYPGHGAEIGFGTVELTPAGQEDPIFAGVGNTLPVFHWHDDTFTLPEGAVLLASNPMYPHQAFRFGTSAYGLQFHIEPDTATWPVWREHLPEGLLTDSEDRRIRIEHVGKGIIARFFDRALKHTAASERNRSN